MGWRRRQWCGLFAVAGLVETQDNRSRYCPQYWLSRLRALSVAEVTARVYREGRALLAVLQQSRAGQCLDSRQVRAAVGGWERSGVDGNEHAALLDYLD